MSIPTTGLFASLAPRKEEILAAAVERAKMGGAQPTLDMVKTAGLHVARCALEDTLRTVCKAQLDVAAMMWTFTGGERPASLPDDDTSYIGWRDGFDQHLMDALGEDVCRAAGQDFMGEYLTDSTLDEETVRVAAATAMAQNIVQSNVLARQAGQVLAEIGIVHDDLLKVAVVTDKVTPAETATIAESHARAHVEQLVGNYAIKNAIYDPAALTEVLAGAFDDDDFLPLGYIDRLGGTAADAPYFRAYYKAAGADAAKNTAQAAMMAALTGAVVEMPKDAPKPKKGKGKKGETAALPPAVAPPPLPVVAGAYPTETTRAAGDDDVSEVIKLMLEHGGDGQTELGELVGKSRGHINNVKNGKSTVSVTPTQRKALASRLTLRINGLQTALDRLA